MQSDPNDYVLSKIVSTASVASAVADSNSPQSRSELDSHANMIVLGKHCFVFDNIHGQTCEVQPFDPSLGTVKEVPIVDAAVAYDCPYTHKTYLLMFRNALHVPSMDNNLIPPFIMHEAGLNGKASCTSNSKHVAIKYFWCKGKNPYATVLLRRCWQTICQSHYKENCSSYFDMCSWDGNISQLCLTSSVQRRSVLKVTVV